MRGIKSDITAGNGRCGYFARKLPRLRDVHVATPQPKTSVSCVQIGQPRANTIFKAGYGDLLASDWAARFGKGFARTKVFQLPRFYLDLD